MEWDRMSMIISSSQHCTRDLRKWKWESLSRVTLQPHELYSPWNSPGQTTQVDILSLLQCIFQTQGSNPGLPHCWQILYQMSYQGSPSGSYLGRLEVLAMEIRQEKDWKIKKKEKMVLFTDKKIVFIEKESLLLKFWWVFSNIAEYNIKVQK